MFISISFVFRFFFFYNSSVSSHFVVFFLCFSLVYFVFSLLLTTVAWRWLRFSWIPSNAIGKLLHTHTHTRRAHWIFSRHHQFHRHHSVGQSVGRSIDRTDGGRNRSWMALRCSCVSVLTPKTQEPMTWRFPFSLFHSFIFNECICAYARRIKLQMNFFFDSSEKISFSLSSDLHDYPICLVCLAASAVAVVTITRSKTKRNETKKNLFSFILFRIALL